MSSLQKLSLQSCSLSFVTILWDPGFVEGLVHAPFWPCCRNIVVNDITFRTFMLVVSSGGSDELSRFSLLGVI
jgi:hypothetical protein